MTDAFYGIDRNRKAVEPNFAIRTHSARSMQRSFRPSSAAFTGRPMSALIRPASRVGSRPQTADPRNASRNNSRASTPAANKTPMQRAIDGDTGPPMLGISGMALTELEKMYRDEFEGVLVASCDHPYVSTTSWNKSSIPHNMLTGNALSPCYFSTAWASEYQLGFYARSRKEQMAANSALNAVGVRSEQVRHLG